MAFKNARLSPIAYANGFTLWHYQATEDIQTIDNDPQFFGVMWTICACGDIFYITTQGRTYQRQIEEIKEGYIKLTKIGD